MIVLKLLNTYTYEIKKSKFIGYYYELDSIDDVQEILNSLKIEHKKARHIPYAYKFENTAKKSDDKEPSNTAGLPIYDIIERNNLNNVFICVVRYFGGIKLGAGPLLRSYSHTANEVIKL